MRVGVAALCAAAGLIVTQACGLFETDPFFYHAAATYGCGPANQKTTLIFLSEKPIESIPPSAPYVSVQLSPSPDTLAGYIWAITRDGPLSAQYVQWAGLLSKPASSGTLEVVSVDSTNTVRGQVDLRFSGSEVIATFRADWIAASLPCN